MLTNQPLPTGDRLAILGNSGGVNVLAANAADAAGLRVPELPELANPLDLRAAAGPNAFAGSLERIAATGEVDAVLVLVAATRANDVPAVLASLTAVADQRRLPLAVVVLGASQPPAALGALRVPVFDLPERAVRAIGHAARYAAWRREPLGSPPCCPMSTLSARGTRRTRRLPPARAGSRTRRWRRSSAPTASRSSGRSMPKRRTTRPRGHPLGYPVAVKAADPALVHKSDIGAVRLGLADASAVRKAYRVVTRAARPVWVDAGEAGRKPPSRARAAGGPQSRARPSRGRAPVAGAPSGGRASVAGALQCGCSPSSRVASTAA
jgi:acyl-CoA synthetase (NDP forming)